MTKNDLYHRKVRMFFIKLLSPKEDHDGRQLLFGFDFLVAVYLLYRYVRNLGAQGFGFS